MGQTRHPPKSRAFKSRFSFKVGQHLQQQLYLQYKVCWILYKIVVATSFSQHYLCIQLPLKFPPKILSSTSVNFQQTLEPITPLLLTKSFVQSLLTLPSTILQQFFASLFLRTTIPAIYTKNIFPTSAI